MEAAPPNDNSDVNIINFTIVVSLFVIIVWLMNDAPDTLIADTTDKIVFLCDGR
jgi:hypothetical protein